LGEDGTKARTFVYGGGAVLATQKFYGTNQAVEWEHRDPSNATFRVTAVGGSLLQFAELDPTNADAGMHAPLISPEPRDDSGTSLLPYGSFMSARTGLGTSYRVDGIIVSADYFMMQLDSLFHGSSLQMAEYTGRASSRIVGYRSTGVRFGRTFNATYDARGHITSLSEGTTQDSSLAGYSIDTPIYDTSWSFAFTVLPQDTKIPLSRADISALIDDVYQMFKKHSGCEDSINKFLGEVKASTGHDVGNIGNILEDFRKNGSINIEGIKGFNAGGAGPKTINISPDARGNAATVLGEIIHSAGRSPGGPAMGYYDDVAIANFYIKSGVVMSVEQYKSTYPKWVEKRIKEWGGDFLEGSLGHGGIEITCLGVVNGLSPKYAKP
jgi:hypothetical protein